MDKHTKQQALLQHLHSLAAQPQEQVHDAIELLGKERGVQVVSAALEILAAAPGTEVGKVAEARTVLLRLYEYYDEAPVKRDAGGRLRGLILKALEPVARSVDAELAGRAAMTFEFLPPRREECAGGLRVAGLALLESLDGTLADYHAVRLLHDGYTSGMSGEPAVSAVQVLANRGECLPVYGFVVGSLLQDELLMRLRAETKSVPELMGECLRSLAQAPGSVVDDVFARYMAYSQAAMMLTYETKADVELAGLFDLLLAQAPQQKYLDFLEGFLCKTERDALYQYVVALLVARSDADLRAVLVAVAHQEEHVYRAGILLEALALIEQEQGIADVMRELRRRL